MLHNYVVTSYYLCNNWFSIYELTKSDPLMFKTNFKKL